MSAAESLEELAERVDEITSAAMRIPPLDAARAACGETGIRDARQSLRNAVAGLRRSQERHDAAQDALRSAQAAQREVTEEHAQAVGAAEWRLDDAFVKEGNTTYLIVLAAEGEQRKAMTADERRDYKAREATNDVVVKACALALRKATDTVERCRDEVASAERGYSAAKRELDAAVADVTAACAELNALATALPLVDR